MPLIEWYGKKKMSLGFSSWETPINKVNHQLSYLTIASRGQTIASRGQTIASRGQTIASRGQCTWHRVKEFRS